MSDFKHSTCSYVGIVIKIKSISYWVFNMRTVAVIVEDVGNNLSAYIEGIPVMTVGNDVKEIEKNMQEAVELYLESCKEINITPVEILQGEFTLKFKIDVATFINYTAVS